MRDHPATGLSFTPRLPSRITKLRFRMRYQARLLEVTLVHHSATYELLDGDELTITERGEEITLEPGKVETRPIPDLPAVPRPKQPAGREPMPRAALTS